MRQTTLILAVAAVLTLIIFLISPGYGIVLIFVELLAGGVYYARPQCTYCGARGQIQRTGSFVVSRVPAYGVVTRTDTVTKNRRRSDGTSYKEETQINRQERVPTLRLTTRDLYQCAKCSNKWSKDHQTEVEDFTRETPKDPNKTVIIEREVVKVPCRYCGMLIDLVRDAKCPSCGANLKVPGS